jgi:hypothetical protein
MVTRQGAEESVSPPPTGTEAGRRQPEQYMCKCRKEGTYSTGTENQAPPEKRNRLPGIRERNPP